MISLINSTKHLKMKYCQFYTNSSWKLNIMEYVSTHSISPGTPRYQNQARLYREIKIMYQNTTKILNKILANWIYQYKKITTQNYQIWFLQVDLTLVKSKFIHFINNKKQIKWPSQYMQKKQFTKSHINYWLKFSKY